MLSSEARKFLLDMRLFLTAKSVKESDIENFLEDAELHLIEAESEGKSVEDIFGSSPKEYADELVKVMERDRQETWKQIGFTVMNIVSFWIIASILIVNHGMLQISLIQCIGYSFSFILVVIGPNFLLRKMTFCNKFFKNVVFYVVFSNDSANVFNGSYYGTRCDISYKNVYIQSNAKLFIGWWYFYHYSSGKYVF